jgi:tyrosyl-tRNA synthetase
VFPSKGELRKLAQQNGLSVNKEKVADINEAATDTLLLAGKYILVQKGKKQYYLIIAE